MDQKDRLGCPAGTAIEVSWGELRPYPRSNEEPPETLLKPDRLFVRGLGRGRIHSLQVPDGRGEERWIDAGARGTLLAAGMGGIMAVGAGRGGAGDMEKSLIPSSVSHHLHSCGSSLGFC